MSDRAPLFHQKLNGLPRGTRRLMNSPQSLLGIILIHARTMR